MALAWRLCLVSFSLIGPFAGELRFVSCFALFGLSVIDPSAGENYVEFLCFWFSLFGGENDQTSISEVLPRKPLRFAYVLKPKSVDIAFLRLCEISVRKSSTNVCPKGLHQGT